MRFRSFLYFFVVSLLYFDVCGLSCEDLLRYKFKKGEILQHYSQAEAITMSNRSEDIVQDKGSATIFETCLEIVSKSDCKIQKLYTLEGNISNGCLLKTGEKINNKVIVIQDERGYEKVVQDSPVKTIINIPIFPKKAVKVGDSWTSRGKFRYQNIFQSNQKIESNVTVEYKYVEKKFIDGRQVAIISINWNRDVAFDKKKNKIVKFKIESSGQMYFDIMAGRLYHYLNDYSIKVTFLNGEVLDIRNSSFSKVTVRK